MKLSILSDNLDFSSLAPALTIVSSGNSDPPCNFGPRKLVSESDKPGA